MSLRPLLLALPIAVFSCCPSRSGPGLPPLPEPAAAAGRRPHRILFHGRVLDPAGMPISGARVTAETEGRAIRPAGDHGHGCRRPVHPRARRRPLRRARRGGRVRGDGAAREPHAGQRSGRSTSSCRRESTNPSPCGAENGYQAPAISSGTKTPTPLRDVPQSVTVVTRQLMQDQLMTSVGDVVRYVPGRHPAPGGEQPRPGHHPRQQLLGGLLRRRRPRRRPVLPRPVQPRSRGGPEGAERDDLRARRRRRRDQSRHQGGRVRRSARSRPAGRLLLQQARHRGFRPAAQRQARPALERALRGLRQLPRRRRPPALRHRADPDLVPGDATKVTVGYEHLRDTRVADRGITSFQGRPADVDIDTFYGNPGRQPRAGDGRSRVGHRRASLRRADPPQPDALRRL